MAYTLSGKSFVIRDADGAHVPNDPRNRDWRAYQAWLAAGGKPGPVRVTATTNPAPDARTVLASLGFTPEQIETAIKHAGG